MKNRKVFHLFIFVLFKLPYFITHNPTSANNVSDLYLNYMPLTFQRMLSLRVSPKSNKNDENLIKQSTNKRKIKNKNTCWMTKKNCEQILPLENWRKTNHCCLLIKIKTKSHLAKMCLWRPQISFIRMGNRRMIGKWLFKSIFRILGKMLDQTCSTWNRMNVICRLVMPCLVLFASFSTFASFANCNSDCFVWSYKENCS